MSPRLVVAALSLICALLVAAVPASATPQPGQEDVTTTVPVSDEDSPLGDIIPRPNTGRAPDSPNDPGGWQQYLVFALLLGGMAAIVLLVRRESRRARAARGG
ncbi:hypothetical protein [Actinomarinicola tropica]|uniref:LPXTG cell wall anchor domain-containing protein n=1 Tax=Actinomarinicola tropica TaxID=2789776 RepID=A0A5Q2RDA6_9ACTN|nr:hypothetical protein [Actinomarinicola tropica]QGG94879.1 hypothetical protein GH723_07025 [Actinomarinicola tropica]